MCNNLNAKTTLGIRERPVTVRKRHHHTHVVTAPVEAFIPRWWEFKRKSDQLSLKKTFLSIYLRYNRASLHLVISLGKTKALSTQRLLPERSKQSPSEQTKSGIDPNAHQQENRRTHCGPLVTESARRGKGLNCDTSHSMDELGQSRQAEAVGQGRMRPLWPPSSWGSRRRGKPPTTRKANHRGLEKGRWEGREGWWQQRTRKLLGVTNRYVSLKVVVVSLVRVYFQTYQRIPFNRVV